MSGPKTVSYTVDRAAIRRQEQERESDQARRQRIENEAAREENRRRKEEERRRKEEERRQKQEQQQRSLEVGELKCHAKDVHKRLVDLQNEILRWQTLSPGSLELNMKVTSPPSGDNQDNLRRYISDNRGLIQSIESQLAQKRPSLEAAQASRSLAAALTTKTTGAMRTAQEVLASCAPVAQQAETSPEQVKDPLLELRDHMTESVRHFLQLEKTPLSAELEKLMVALFDATDERIASGLALEIDAALDSLRQQLAVEKEEAKRLMSGLPQSKLASVVELRLRLGEVCAGNERLSQEMRDSVQEAMHLVEAEEREDRAAVSRTVHDALENLGYEVEPIESTMFVKEGVVHFRKAGWDDGYYVRMRMDGGKMNFNVVQVAQDVGSSKVTDKDVAMENSWCSAFPQIMDTFASRSIATCVERHLLPGELPVQKVDIKTLNSEYWQERANQRKQADSSSAQPKQLHRE